MPIRSAAPVIDGEFIRLWSAAGRLTDTLRRVQRAAASTGRPWGETHTVPTLVVCLEGVARVALPRGAIDLQAGGAVVIPPGCRHEHAALRAGAAILSLGFMLGRSDIELTTPRRTCVLTIPEQPARALLEDACRQPLSELPSLVRRALTGLANESAAPMAPMPEAVERMWLHLRRERLSPISAADVLRASRLGQTRAHALFRAWFGATPHQLLRHHRLEYARHLLSEGNSIAAVASACGFRTRRQFTAAFNRTVGMPPSAWSPTSGTKSVADE